VYKNREYGYRTTSLSIRVRWGVNKDDEMKPERAHSEHLMRAMHLNKTAVRGGNRGIKETMRKL